MQVYILTFDSRPSLTRAFDAVLSSPDVDSCMIEADRTRIRFMAPLAAAEKLLEQIEPDRNYAIDSIRHPAEVEALRAGGTPFHLVWVEADLERRFIRLQERGRSGDPQTLGELERLEGLELGSDDPAAQQLLAVRELADFSLDNGASLEDLQHALQEILERSFFFERPSWDEYFMSIARVVASRSNCVKRKVAAVITLDRRIISTGYNGTPRGTRLPSPDGMRVASEEGSQGCERGNPSYSRGPRRLPIPTRGVPKRLSTRSSSKPAAPPPLRPKAPRISSSTPSKIHAARGSSAPGWRR